MKHSKNFRYNTLYITTKENWNEHVEKLGSHWIPKNHEI